MPASPELARAQRLLQLFLKLHAIMEAEHENNWIRGVENVIAVLREAEENSSKAANLVSEARQAYLSMNAGNGSFSDFHVWRDNFEERVKVNKDLNKITEAIWQEFEAYA